ncbi:MFS transporter [Lactobacillus jensenii]|jgi:major facilitator superfamily permease|uniref:MFS transporter n=2 Tax=Lactobacillus jensenii TaxID=109790 RepID=A0A5N1IIJ9_LACJE|nr:MFS transporter [Lactobacillus jensenii]EEQ67962.1 transporter, major facilitator family protein [Lactobacillus jensenii 1153]EEQ23895.1 transporter, major facilitator family protein [Lactobacillus jensenii 269-3]KAA9236221.1 MFS transporter [Lactobacillus jensenii]KAA9258818.1 MFS transporter [Lactobacillus jensenii]KAA9320403.1 MFS transporter [Lactobacillus jensenii]
MLKLKKNLSVYTLLAGRVATNIADSLFYLAILWYFKQVTHSTMSVSIIFAITSGIDMLSFGFGPIIDRVSIKKLLKISTILQALISIVVFLALITQFHNLLMTIVLMLLFIASTILSAIIYPAQYKLLPVLVPEREILRFNGLFQVTFTTLDMILDAGVTVIIALFSIDATVILSALVFALALLFYAHVNISVSAKDILEEDEYFSDSYLNDILIGWKTLKKEKNILELILPLGVVNFFYGIFTVGLPYFAQDYIHNSIIGYGELLLASSIGGVLGAFLVQKFKASKKEMRLFVAICFLGAAIFRLIVPLSVNLNIWILLLSSAISSAWITMMNTNFEALVQVSFSSAILGRVQTINDSILSIMIPIGSIFGGWIVKSWGSLSTQYIYGFALFLSAIYYFLVIRLKSK